jgi:hypothetical protein
LVEASPPVHGFVSSNNGTNVEIFLGGSLISGYVPFDVEVYYVCRGAEMEPNSIFSELVPNFLGVLSVGALLGGVVPAVQFQRNVNDKALLFKA